ncbi:hypothetical protein, partial [Angustibacter sp. Root456]|uniref:hypothetical protein n=1 Tax=Angustibacter sp. Root456 TaxID=1736539 RepID=UPI00138EEF2F
WPRGVHFQPTLKGQFSGVADTSTNPVTNPEDQPTRAEDEVTPEQKAKLDEVWNEAGASFASEAAAKAARGEPLNFIEREALEQREQALSLVPSFDD